MRPIVRTIHHALLAVSLEYIQKKGLELSGFTETEDASHAEEDFSMISSVLSLEALSAQIETIDAGESRKSLLIFLIKAAKYLETHEDIEDVLSILADLHSLYLINNNTTKTVLLAEESFELYGFFGWRNSSASMLLQERVFTGIFGIPDNVSSLSWHVMKTIIQAKFEQKIIPELVVGEVSLLVDVDTEIASGSGIGVKPVSKEDESGVFLEMQKVIAIKEAKIMEMQAKLADVVSRSKELQGRYQFLTEEVKKLELQNKGLKDTVASQTEEISGLRGQLIISQEQFELQQLELANLQKKLKERDKTPTFPVSGISRGTTFAVPTLAGASHTGIFSGNTSLFADGPRQRKPVSSPGKK